MKISQDSVALQLKCGGMFNNLRPPTLKKFKDTNKYKLKDISKDKFNIHTDCKILQNP